MNRYQHPFDFAQQLRNEEPTPTELSPRTRRKYLWLATVPEALQTIMRKNTEIFTARILLNLFASRQTFYAKDGWRNLRNEVT